MEGDVEVPVLDVAFRRRHHLDPEGREPLAVALGGGPARAQTLGQDFQGLVEIGGVEAAETHPLEPGRDRDRDRGLARRLEAGDRLVGRRRADAAVVDREPRVVVEAGEGDLEVALARGEVPEPDVVLDVARAGEAARGELREAVGGGPHHVQAGPREIAERAAIEHHAHAAPRAAPHPAAELVEL